MDGFRSIETGQALGVEFVVEMLLEVWDVQDRGWVEVKFGHFFQHTFFQERELAV